MASAAAHAEGPGVHHTAMVRIRTKVYFSFGRRYKTNLGAFCCVARASQSQWLHVRRCSVSYRAPNHFFVLRFPLSSLSFCIGIFNSVFFPCRQLPEHVDGVKAQEEIYTDILGACLSEPAFDGVICWGFTDKYSW